MKKLFLLGLPLVWAGCQPSNEIMPEITPASGEVTGNYQTNGYLDLQTIPLSTGQLPTADVKAQSDSEITLTLNQHYPAVQQTTLRNVILRRQPDSSILLNYQGQVIGSYQTDRIFTNSGMEAQGKVLRINSADRTKPLVFIGYK